MLENGFLGVLSTGVSEFKLTASPVFWALSTKRSVLELFDVIEILSVLQIFKGN
jgi:hypothetical protein